MEKWKAALFSYPSKMKDYLFYNKPFASIPLDKSMDKHDCHVDLVTCTVVEPPY